MVSRLVLGCGSVGRKLALEVTDHADELLVLTDDEARVQSLRDEGVAAQAVDPTDATAIRAAAGRVDSVIVGGEGSADNRRAARAARGSFPDALLLAYTGQDPTAEDRRALQEIADRVVDRGQAVAAALLGRVGDDGYRLRRLNRVLGNLEGRLAVVAHDNPDPDAIASAVALATLAERAGLDVDVCHYGDINHQENRALVNLLAFDLTALDPAEDPRETYGGFALVDHSRPGVNDQLPPDTPIDIVIDHHPPRAPVAASFVDLRSDVGATSTLLTDYLERFGVQPTEAVATGLLFGIRVDTDNFSREVSVDDFRAAAHLLPHVDRSALERIESPSVSVETLECIGRAIRHRTVHGGVLVSSVGRTGDRDALAQAADRLLDLEGITTTFVYGYTDETVFGSARGRGTDLDIGETLREAFGQIGSAGGHGDMAGAQIPVGSLAVAFDPDAGADHDPEADLRESIDQRFLEALDIRPDRAASAVYGRDYFGTGTGFAPGDIVTGVGSEIGATDDTGDGDAEGADSVDAAEHTGEGDADPGGARPARDPSS